MSEWWRRGNRNRDDKQLFLVTVGKKGRRELNNWRGKWGQVKISVVLIRQAENIWKSVGKIQLKG